MAALRVDETVAEVGRSSREDEETSHVKRRKLWDEAWILINSGTSPNSGSFEKHQLLWISPGVSSPRPLSSSNATRMQYGYCFDPSYSSPRNISPSGLSKDIFEIHAWSSFTACVYLNNSGFWCCFSKPINSPSRWLACGQAITPTLEILEADLWAFYSIYNQSGPAWREGRAEVELWLAPCENTSICARLACIWAWLDGVGKSLARNCMLSVSNGSTKYTGTSSSSSSSSYLNRSASGESKPALGGKRMPLRSIQSRPPLPCLRLNEGWLWQGPS